jgi:hypothetical protein
MRSAQVAVLGVLVLIAASAVVTETAAQFEPLETRLGGSRDAFEENYGKPNSTDLEGVFPFGVEYRIEGYDTVDVFYHKDLALLIRLNADRSPGSGEQRRAATGWSVAEADELAREFLPADVEIEGEAVEDGSRRLVTEGHSTALEERFGRATYQQYGAVGDRGDVHYLMFLDADGTVSSIEIRLGSAAAATTALSPPEQAYATAAEQRLRLLAESRRRVDVLLREERYGDDDWTDAVRAELVFWRLTEVTVRGLSPPEALTEIHETYLDALALYASAADDIDEALASQDRDRIDRATDKSRYADRLVGDAERALVDLEAERAG